MKVLRSSGSHYVAPGLHVNTGILKNLERADGQSPQVATIKVAQVITPESKSALHYWFIGHRDFAHDRPDIDEFMANAQRKAFAEDQFAIEQISRLEHVDVAAPFAETHIPTDAAGIAMRKRLRALAGS
jgi:Vanillate O-demethylase oxygenase C-terminal domain